MSSTTRSRVEVVTAAEARPHVLHILYGGLGGQVAVANELARGMQQRGLVSAACLYGPRDELLLHPQSWPAFSTVVAIDKQRRLDLAGSRAIGQLLRRLRPAAVVWHSAYAPLAILRSRLRRRVRTVIAVEHQAIDLRRWPDDLRSVASAILSSAVVFLSTEYAERYFLASIPLPSIRRAQIAPNGIDLSQFTPSRGSGQGPPFVIGMIGRMVPGKDFDSLIRAFAHLCAADTDLELHLAGNGPRRAELESLARSLGVSDRIRFVGYLEANEISGFMRSLDIYVHATFGETNPTAILQAYAAALAVLGSDVPGVNTLIRDRVDGRLVRSGDPSRIAEAIGELRQDDAARAALGYQARERALSEFGADRMVERYLQVLARCDARGPWAAALQGTALLRDHGSIANS